MTTPNPRSADLALTGLTKTYRPSGKEEVPAVRGIDLSVAAGEFLGLLGPSGCGKSSTLRMIAGLEDVSGGDIRIAGRSIKGLPPHKRNVAVAFENYALYPPLTVEENITFGMKARREANPTQRARDVAERLGITAILGQKPGGLSSGQKQRVSLARAIVRQPDILLLDEPLSHLDASERDKTRRELKRLQRETGYTTVLVTHDQHEALSLADRIAVMDGGVFKQIGTPDEVYDAPDNLFVADFVGEPRMNLLPGVAEAGGVRLSSEVLVPGGDADGVAGDAPAAATGSAVVVGIRPQDIRVSRERVEGWLPARVFVFEPLQEVGRLTLALPGVAERLVVETSHAFSAEREEALWVAFPPERTHLFDKAGGERVAWPR